MSEELTKTFFDTFGIEPYCKYLLVDLTTKRNNEKLMDKTNFIDFVKTGKDYLLLKVIKYYPRITDRILLELICILSEWRVYLHSEYTIKSHNINSLKEDVLNDFLSMHNWYKIKKCDKDIKHQVQELFKENN